MAIPNKIREPKTPEEALSLLSQVKKEDINIGQDLTSSRATDPQDVLRNRMEFGKAQAEVFLGGFVTTTASDLYRMTGDLDEAQRADDLIKLLGEDLYLSVRNIAKCSGIDNEADWLAQQVWALLQADIFDTTGAADARNKEVDDNPSSPVNKLISQYLRPSNLGRIVQAARAAEPKVSNAAALRAATYNFVVAKLQKGL